MENPIEKKLSLLCSQAEKAERGCTKHIVDIKLLHNDATSLKKDRELAVQLSQDVQWNIALRLGYTKDVADAVAGGVLFARTAKNVLQKHCGTQYCRLWNPVGFTGSLEVPATAAEVKALLTSMHDYFTKKPERAVESLGVTAALAEAARKAIKDAEDALQDFDDEAEVKMTARDNAVEALRARLRGLINELEQLIGREDRRWHGFGFNIPAEPDTPAAPQGVSVEAVGPGQARVEAEPVAFADHYRFWTQPVGSTETPVDAGSSREPSLLLENLPGGARLGVSVSAVNKAGHEGPRSATVNFTVASLASIAAA